MSFSLEVIVKSNLNSTSSAQCQCNGVHENIFIFFVWFTFASIRDGLDLFYFGIALGTSSDEA